MLISNCHINKYDLLTYLQVKLWYKRHLCNADAFDLNVSFQFMLTRRNWVEYVDGQLHGTGLDCSHLAYVVIITAVAYSQLHSADDTAIES